MNKTFIEGKKFQRVNFSRDILVKGDYDHCTFDNCIFLNSNMSEVNFIDCEFHHCDFSVTKVSRASFRDVTFNGCKVSGVHFEECNTFGFSADFESCQLRLSSFYKLSLKNTQFKECDLQEVDFSESNLTGVVFDRCNLSGTIFKNTVMEKADFRTSYNYSIDPEINRVRKAKFSAPSVLGLLDKYDIIIE